MSSSFCFSSFDTKATGQNLAVDTKATAQNLSVDTKATETVYLDRTLLLIQKLLKQFIWTEPSKS
jgi:hypothetical protein